MSWGGPEFVVLIILISTIGAGSLPTWVKVVGLGLSLPAAVLGGHFAKLKMSRPAA